MSDLGLFPVGAWDEVVGQDRAVELLRSAAAGDPVHAYRQLKRYTQLLFGFGR